MQFVDFFAGIGGIRLGLEQAGHKCVGFCEFDKYARTAYKAMYDTEGEWENHDVRTVKPYDVPAADLWCFGFPCQDISVAGKQKGLQEGERSGLFYEIMRLLAGRRQEDRPRWLLVENVKNLLSIGNGFDFARLLCEVGGYGYSLQWDTLNSKDYGVPQNRERVFIVGYLGDIRGREVFPLRPTDGENPCELNEITQGLSMAYRVYNPDGISKTLADVGGGAGAKTGLYAVKVLKPYGSTGGVCGFKIAENKTGIASTCAARDYKGISRHNGNAVVCMSIRGQKLQEEIDTAPTIDTDCRNNLTRKQTCCAVLTPGREEKRQNGRRMKGDGEPMFTLTAQDRHGVAIIDDQGRANKKLTPRDICPTLRAQSHGNEPKVAIAYDEQNNTLRTDGTDKALKVIDVYNKRELKGGIVGTLTASGNTSIWHCGTFLVAEHNDADIYTGGTVGTLTTDGSSPKHNNRVIVGGLPIREATNKGYSVAYPGDGVNIGMPNSTTRRGRVNHGLANTLTTASEMGVIDHAIRIRRLTPRECWRLQGFPDEYFDKAKAAGISDTQLYKQAGNGVTVNVARAIGERLKEVEKHGCKANR